MKKLNDEELRGVNGGISALMVVGIGTIITFLSGIVVGIAKPSKCHIGG